VRAGGPNLPEADKRGEGRGPNLGEGEKRHEANNFSSRLFFLK